MTLVLASVTALVGVIPLLVFGRVKAATILGSIAFLAALLIYYCALPSLVWPLWGGVGGFVALLWFVSAIVYCVHEDNFTHALWFPAVAAGIFLGHGCAGCEAVRSSDYRGLIGSVENRTWTEDIQPANPRHIRIVPNELALWLADKQLGVAPGAIGSQFQVSGDHLTIQRIKGELWYVAPLDFKDYGVYSSTHSAPGYVMISAEDPTRDVVVKTDEHYRYMPGAYFSQNLERYLWQAGFYAQGLTDYTFEIDESGKAWWVITVFEPTLAWSGDKILGVIILNPTDGSYTYYLKDKVPEWVDRVVPGDFIGAYITYYGKYADGWINSWWAEKNITVPETPHIVYGADGEPYWVTGVTSSNAKDQAVVGFMYTHARTGKSVFYRAAGSTDDAVLKAVNSKVSYRHWEGFAPSLYNIYGTMASIVPILGESHNFQGVAIVRLDNLQVALGDDQYVALREYQKLLAQSGAQIAPELAHNQVHAEGIVDRFAAEVKSAGNSTETFYYVHLQGVPHLFTSGSELSPKLPMTQSGDTVRITYVDSPEDVVPLTGFDNLSLALKTAPSQDEVRNRAKDHRDTKNAQEDTRSMRDKLEHMSDQELQEFLQREKPHMDESPKK